MMFGIANAHDAVGQDKFDAGFVLNKMDNERQSAFVIGVIEGLAYARFLRDKPNEEGMKCVTGWLYNDAAKRWKIIHAVFKKYQDKPPAVLLHVLIEKQCGE